MEGDSGAAGLVEANLAKSRPKLLGWRGQHGARCHHSDERLQRPSTT